MIETRFPAEKGKYLMGPVTMRNIRLGIGSYVQSDCILIATEKHMIRIGDNCAIGHWCYITTKMHSTEDHTQIFYGNITICDNTWLGNGVVVYPNVIIGADCVIGAHTVITHDIPDGSKVFNIKQIQKEFRD
jgi:maltose O-acetyltransferase